MLKFELDNLSAKELFKDVLIRFVNGDELTMNYFELKNREVSIAFHEHPVEHLVIILEGEIEFIFKEKRLFLKEKTGLFLPAKTMHSARVISAPVRALEIFTLVKDKYYE